MSRSTNQDLLRSAAGVLLAAGAFVLFARKSNHGWGAFALLVVLAAPAAVLYAFALRDPGEPDAPLMTGNTNREQFAVRSRL